MISFCLYYAHHYAARPDSLKNLIFIITFITLYATCHSRKVWPYIVTTLLVFVSIFTKQDSLIFIPAILVYYLVQKDYRGLKITLLLTACLMAILVIFMFNHDHWYKNMVAGLNQGISLQYVLEMYEQQLFPRFLFLFLVFSFAINRVNKEIKGYSGMVAMCTVLFLGSCITSLKWGSTPVYYTEFFQVLLIIIAIHWDKQARLKSRLLNLEFAFLPLLLVGILSYESYSELIKVFDKSENLKCKSDYQECAKIAVWINNNTKNQHHFNVLSFEKPIINHLAARCVFPTYETEFPEFLFCIPFPPDNRPNAIYKYKSFRNGYAKDSVAFFITAKPECNTTFLGIKLIDKKIKYQIGHYSIYTN